jgi:hypothetical protein
VKGVGPYASAKVPDRKYLWTVVALFGLLGIVGLGTFLYRPLRVKFIISRLKTEDPNSRDSAGHNRYLNRLFECFHAALAGNREARQFILAEASGRGGHVWPEFYDAMVLRLVISDPPGCMAVLDALPDGQVRYALASIEQSASHYYLYGEPFNPTCEPLLENPKALAEALENIAEARISDAQPRAKKISPTPEKKAEARRVARAALDLLRSRFAKELAEAEKAEKAKP